MTKGHPNLLWLTVLGFLFTYHSNVGRCQVETEGALTPQEQEALRFIARTTVACVVQGKDIPSFPVSSKRLEEHRGAFVTLKNGGRLRGCIGTLLGTMPLCKTIERMAIQAATKDSRFPPVSKPELPSLEIEISIIGPLRPIKSLEEIVVGTHGLLMIHGNRSGVLLPQVAVEQCWDRKTFLEGVSRKAGLPKDAWKGKKSRVYVFTAEVF